MPTLYNTNHAESWEFYADPTNGVIFGKTARQLRIGGNGDLYLIPVAGNTEKLYATGMVAGEQIDVQCDGIGPSTTCTLVTAHF